MDIFNMTSVVNVLTVVVGTCAASGRAPTVGESGCSLQV